MLFTLEALEAKEGDSLLLHWGDPDAPRLILIDGGPRGVYNKTLKPRLLELREAQDDPDEQLRIEILMVSHIDADHIAGILDLTNAMIRDLERNRTPLCRILTLWHNSFDDLVAGEGADLLSAVGASVAAASAGGASLPGIHLSHQSELVLAGVGQGRSLRQNAERLALNLNSPFAELVQAPAQGRSEVELSDGLKLTVLGPDKPQIDELREKWKKDLPEILAKEKKEAEAAAYLDSSAANLSSISVLAEAADKKMLLTGDARGDCLLEWLEAAGFLTDDPDSQFEVDLLKMPHHGSIHNVDEDFFRRLPTQNYVFSANGRHDNPDLATLEMLSKVRQDDDFTIWLTNHTEWSDEHFEKEYAAGRRYEVIHRDEDDPSVILDLGDDELDR
jgi:hypothetical protein